MKDYSWVVIGVLTILMVDSGQSYYYTCDSDMIDTMVNEVTDNSASIKSDWIQDVHDDIVATTSNYFDKLMADIKDPKTFVCASMYKKPEDRRNRKVIFSVKYRKDDKIIDYPMQSEFTQSRVYKGIVFNKCDECPEIVDKAYAYRFYSKDGVFGVYTCSRNTGNDDQVREGFIKVSFSLTRNADGTGKKELSPETKQRIEEAKAKAKELDIHIVEDVPYGCNTEPPRANTPSPKVSPDERSPANVPPATTALIHKYGIVIILLIVGGFATNVILNAPR